MKKYKLMFGEEEVVAFRFGYEDEPKWLDKFKSRYEYECIENKKQYLYKGEFIAKLKTRFGEQVAQKGDWIFLDSGELETYCDTIFKTYYEEVE